MAEFTQMPFLWMTKLKKCRRIAAVLFLWILCVNIVLALLWLQPMDKTALIFQQNSMELFFSDKGTTSQRNSSATEKIHKANRANYESFETTSKLTSNDQHLDVYFDMEKMSKLSDFLFDVVDSKTSGVPGSNASFVLVIPRRLQRLSLKELSSEDYKSVMTSAHILTALPNLDALACLPRKLLTLVYATNSLSEDELNNIFNKTWCNYARFRWSLHIRNSGNLKPIKSASSQNSLFMQMCNIASGPFLIRKKSFQKIKGLQTNYGRITMLDFFLRSGGNLKIGKFGGCFYSDKFYQPDRGALHGLHDFPEYSDFGVMHGVLRIVMEDRIEWTRCYAVDRLCEEKPYTPPTTLPDAGKPICCSVVLSQMLQAIVSVFDKLGIEYRLLYGTLLGAVRSGAIIPYTHDLDFAVDDRFGLNWSRYDTLQKYFGDNYSISSNSFMGVPRLLPLLPAHITINTAQFFDGELDLEGKRLFSPEINDAVRGLIPFSPSNWRTRGYTDFYRGWPVWWNDSSIVQIDGYNYTAMKETEYEVALWYGQHWRIPIVKFFETQNDRGAV